MSEFLKPLDDAIDNKLLPAIIGSTNISEVDRNMYSLPIKSGGLGIPIFQDKADQNHSTSIQITAPLAAIMVLQGNNLPNPEEEAKVKAEVRRSNSNLQKQREEMIVSSLSERAQKSVEQASEKLAQHPASGISGIYIEQRGV